MRREYVGGAQSARLTSSLGGTTADLTISCNDLTNWPTGIGARPFYVVIDRGTASEEKILCSSRSGNTITVYNVGGNTGRGADDTSITTHASNAVIEHVFTATDADEANAHVNDTTTDVHPQYILESVANAKGDLLVATANDTWSRVGVGTNGQYLVADSAETPGVKWAGLPGVLPHAIAAMDTLITGLSVPPLADGATGASGTITFPTGRFSVAPVVSTALLNTLDPMSTYAQVSPQLTTATQTGLYIMNGGPGAGKSGTGTLTEVRVHMIAVQMSSGSATG